MKILLRSVLPFVLILVFNACSTDSLYKIHNATFEAPDGTGKRNVSTVTVFSKTLQTLWWMNITFNKVIQNDTTKFSITVTSSFSGSNPDPDYKYTVFDIVLGTDDEEILLKIKNTSKGEKYLINSCYAKTRF